MSYRNPCLCRDTPSSPDRDARCGELHGQNLFLSGDTARFVRAAPARCGSSQYRHSGRECPEYRISFQYLSGGRYRTQLREHTQYTYHYSETAPYNSHREWSLTAFPGWSHYHGVGSPTAVTGNWPTWTHFFSCLPAEWSAYRPRLWGNLSEHRSIPQFLLSYRGSAYRHSPIWWRSQPKCPALWLMSSAWFLARRIIHYIFSKRWSFCVPPICAKGRT